jgi:hypothetical protein
VGLTGFLFFFSQIFFQIFVIKKKFGHFGISFLSSVNSTNFLKFWNFFPDFQYHKIGKENPDLGSHRCGENENIDRIPLLSSHGSH